MPKKGWFKQSKRHSLAARGIATKTNPIATQAKITAFNVKLETQPEINWDLTTTDFPTFDDSIKHPDSPYREFDCELRWLTPDEYIILQQKSIGRFYQETGRTPTKSTHDMFMSGYYPDHAHKVKEYMFSGEPIPTFIIEIDDKGVTSFQEGRHRIMVAKQLGIERVPVWFCKKRYKEII